MRSEQEECLLEDGASQKASGVFWKEQSGRKGDDMALTLNPDICTQPTMQAENCYQTKTPANVNTFLSINQVPQRWPVELPPSIKPAPGVLMSIGP